MRRSRRLLLPAALLLTLGGAVAFLALDRGSLERGNRLYRSGSNDEATSVYRSLAAEDRDGMTDGTEGGVASYNLGTALLSRESPEAGEHLRRALESSDTAILGRTHFNLGYELLGRVRSGLEPDSALVYLNESVIHHREALALEPENAAARWNLAMARRSLDSLLLVLATLDARELAENVEEDGIRFESGTLVRAETSDPNSLPGLAGAEPDDSEASEDESRQSAVDGAREAGAGEDEGSLTREEARRTLESFQDDPELLVRGILWINRPDVNWWEPTPYPGGDW